MAIYTDLSYLQELTDNDQDLILQSLHRYLNSSPAQTEKLIESTNDKNWQEIHNSAHSLFATTQIVGMTSIAQDLKDIQRIAYEEKDMEVVTEKVNKISKVISASYKELQEYIDKMK